MLCCTYCGQFEHAGALGIVVRSDQASVAHELGGTPDRAVAAPRNTLQRQLLDGLRYLVKNELKLNQPDASDGWITADAIWLVSKTVSDRLRAHLLSQGIEGVPDRNSTLFNVFQDNGLIVANPAGKAIWDAEILSPTGWKNAFTFLRVHLHSYGQPAKTARSLLAARCKSSTKKQPLPQLPKRRRKSPALLPGAAMPLRQSLKGTNPQVTMDRNPMR
ncbi:hypothetical protein SSTU70S_01333 [Stutzerimonas stutzeri]